MNEHATPLPSDVSPVARRMWEEDVPARALGIEPVATTAGIDFVATAFGDELLVAEAEERRRAGRSGVYDVRVTSDASDLVALFRGRSAAIRGQHLEDPPPA